MSTYFIAKTIHPETINHCPIWKQALIGAYMKMDAKK